MIFYWANTGQLWLRRLPSPLAKVSLGKILNPKLPLMYPSEFECVSVELKKWLGHRKVGV